MDSGGRNLFKGQIRGGPAGQGKRKGWLEVLLFVAMRPESNSDCHGNDKVVTRQSYLDGGFVELTPTPPPRAVGPTL